MVSARDAIGALAVLMLSVRLEAFSICPVVKSSGTCRRAAVSPSAALARARGPSASPSPWVGAVGRARGGALRMTATTVGEVTVSDLEEREFQVCVCVCAVCCDERGNNVKLTALRHEAALIHSRTLFLSIFLSSVPIESPGHKRHCWVSPWMLRCLGFLRSVSKGCVAEERHFLGESRRASRGIVSCWSPCESVSQFGFIL